MFIFSNHVGPELLQKGVPVIRIFDIYRPQIPFDFENICNFINGVFVLQVRTSPLTLHQQHSHRVIPQIQNTAYNVTNEASTNNEDGTIHAQHLKLKGQMMLLNSGDQLIYLCSPYVTSIPELFQVRKICIHLFLDF